MMEDDDGDGTHLDIKVRLFLNRYYQPTGILTKPELPPEEEEKFMIPAPPWHFEYEGVLYRLAGDFIGPNGGKHTYHRHLLYKPEEKLELSDIII